jgi:hypothetical protein
VFVYPHAVKAAALDLIAAGHNDCEVARRLRIPRTTVRDWRRPTYAGKPATTICPRCWRPSWRRINFSEPDYCELLGLYLGDGHIVRTGRSDRLRIYLDPRYTQIIADAAALLRRCFPEHSVGIFRSAKGTTKIVSLYCTHLQCLFPQHAAGQKHLRKIRLEPWQSEILKREPWPFLRGCIRSDGCMFVNRTGPYSYVSYDFSNHSPDILGLFTLACDLVGVEYRAYAQCVRINRRASVALMQEHVGGKA